MQVGLIVRITTQRIAGELRQAVIECLVEQIELQLERDHWVDTLVLQALQHLGQHFAGIEFDGGFGSVRGDKHLPQWLGFPAHRLERARHQPPVGIRVAVVEAIVADLEQATLGAQQHGVLRQLQRAAGGDLFQHLDRVALAVEMPGNVQGDQVDITHLGMLLAEGADFGQ